MNMHSHIENFLTDYVEKSDRYRLIAEKCADTISAELKSAGILAIVTSREKKYDSLKKKLEDPDRINLNGRFSIDDIYHHDKMRDLAGVRVALYFPNHIDRVDKLISNLFQLLEPPKTFPREDNGQTFRGYKARHYQIRLKPENLSATVAKNADIEIELQVASLFMHAWAEVEHDLAYKGLYGALNESEEMLLNQVNGLASACEMAFEQLEKEVHKRVSQETTEFQNQYQLASFLFSEVSGIHPEIHAAGVQALGDMSELFVFLNQAKQNTPSAVAKIVREVDIKALQNTVAEGIIDTIVSRDPAMKNVYFRATHLMNRDVPYAKVSPNIESITGIERGCLIKGSGNHIYWYAQNGIRYVMPNALTYKTWFPPDTEQPMIRLVPDAELASMRIGGNITYRPGSRMIKIATDSKIFAIAKNGFLRWIPNTQIAEAIYGKEWSRLVDVIADAFFVNYSIGPAIQDPTDYNPQKELEATKTIEDNL